jgi:hypothetical protein
MFDDGGVAGKVRGRTRCWPGSPPTSHQRPVVRAAREALLEAVAAGRQGLPLPGCDRPPAWCDAHHVTHWIDGGETNLDNLAHR